MDKLGGPGPESCTFCNRPQKKLKCSACFSEMEGRIKRDCYFHGIVINSSDLSSCPKCRTEGSLKEIGEAALFSNPPWKSPRVAALEKSRLKDSHQATTGEPCFSPGQPQLAGCICLRPDGNVDCMQCGYSFKGRVVKQCPIHLSASFPSDVISCPRCKTTGNLEEGCGSSGLAQDVEGTT